MIKDILEGILSSGRDLKFDEARLLLDAEDKDILSLMQAADTVRRRFCGNRIDLCSILNAKSGLCSEDCAFCSQSARYNTGCSIYPLLEVREIVEAAGFARKQGATNFCIVISGAGPNREEFGRIKEAIKEIIKLGGIKVDCSLGSLTLGMVKELKALGIDRYNHNLETSERFFKEICTTHSYASRLKLVEMLKEVGITPCCGGIIGMGETKDDRIDMAFTFKRLGIRCIPINILNPRKGTPLENIKPIEPLEVIKTIAVFRLILPNSIIKIAGGREPGLRDLQALGFMAGANGMIIGGYLTTKGRPVEQDLQLARDLGFEF